MSEITPTQNPAEDPVSDALVSDLRLLIVEAQRHAAAVVNVGLTVLYWRVGRRISQELLGGDRAAYGEALIAQVAERLTGDYGRVLPARISGAWCSSPRRFQMLRLSPHCRDN